MSDDIQHDMNNNKDKPVQDTGLSFDTDTDAATPPSEDPADLNSQIPGDIFDTPTPEEEKADTPAVEAAAGMAAGGAAAAAAAASAPAEDQKKKFSFKSGGMGSKSAPAPAPAPAAPAADKGKAQQKNGNIPRGALNAVVTRNEYYRDGYRNLMKIAFIEGIVIVGLVAAFIVYMNVHAERNRYFATTADGRILQLTPLDQPNISPAALMSWVSQAATEVMTFGFHDYQRRLQDASRHFTRRGWQSFTAALQRSRIIESVEKLQQVVTATPRAAPVLLQEGVFNGRYRWVVRLPLTVTFKSGSKTTSSNLEVTITIERVPTLESPNGVGIESWIAV